MSTAVLLAIAGITVGTRIAALALLPPPQGAAAGLVRRLPPPLFATLAALSLTDADTSDPALLAAIACAVVAARWSSLLITLAAGLTGFAVTTIVW